MRLKVNGELFEAIGAETIFELLDELKIESARVAAVEVNLAIVRKTAFSTYKLNDGDEIEIVNFVGGG